VHDGFHCQLKLSANALASTERHLEWAHSSLQKTSGSSSGSKKGSTSDTQKAALRAVSNHYAECAEEKTTPAPLLGPDRNLGGPQSMQLKVLGIVKDVTRARESTPQSPDNSQLLQPSGNFRFVPFAGTREAPTTARSNTLHTLKHTTCSHLSRSFETSSCSSCSSNSDAGVLGGQTRE
jgi:hypothetical protein